MEIRISRKWRKPKYTIGKLYVDGVAFCDTLEDTDRGLSQDMPIADIKAKKVRGETAIPTGTYNMAWTYSPRFKKMMPLIDDVPGFTGIRIHAGNTPEDSSGCILCGENKQVGKVLNSRTMINKLYPLIEQACKTEGCIITIE